MKPYVKLATIKGAKYISMNRDDNYEVEHSPLISVGGLDDEEARRPSCRKGTIVIAVIITLIICIGIGGAVFFGLRNENGGNGGSSGGTTPPTGVYEHAAVASDATLCSQAGAGILKDGGSAVDSAIATIFCLGVVNCHSTGLGGGGFMVVHQKDNPLQPVVIDFREKAPSGAHKDMYSENSSLSQIGECYYGISWIMLLQ